ncbi:MAG: aminotransferase class III-fold pyridoxal phosphate-dependent enzyme [Pseudobdellovibrionaceae bacterium]
MEHPLVGQKIKASSNIHGLIEKLVHEVTGFNNQLSGIQAPKPELLDHGKKMVDQVGLYRGRPLNYAYVGTGAGRGPYVELSDGSVKLDLINGIGIHLMGHSHPRVIAAAVRGALSDVIMQGNLQPNLEYMQFSEKLTRLAAKNSRMKYVWMSTCGSVANENALKLSRQKHTPARMVVSFKNAFAGRTTMMAEVTDNAAYKQGLPEYHEVLRIPFYDKRDPVSGEKALSALKEHIAKHPGNISVFSFEPMLGEGGYQAAPREFFIPLLEECRKHHIAIWADEVQTFARTGEMFAYETLKIGEYIDICTVAKTAQLGATFYTEEYNPKPGLIAGTFSGASVSMAAGMEIMDMMQEGFLGPQGRIQKIHQKFISGLNRLNETTCKGKSQDAGGMGLMIAFTPFEGKKEQVDALLKKLFQKGVIAFSCGKEPVRIRFLVPAIIQDEDIDVALKIIEECLIEGVA